MLSYHQEHGKDQYVAAHVREVIKVEPEDVIRNITVTLSLSRCKKRFTLEANGSK